MTRASVMLCAILAFSCADESRDVSMATIYFRDLLSVVVEWGRSNEVGHGAVASLTAQEQAEDTRWTEWEVLGEPWTMQPQDFVWDPGGPQFRRNANGVLSKNIFGPDLFTGRTIAEAGRRVAVIKYGHGGTILQLWRPSAADEFLVGLEVTKQALAALTEPYRIAAFVLRNCEGESTAARKAVYAIAMDEIITEVRAQLGVPDLPFFFMGVCDNWNVQDAPGLLAIQQAYAASRPNTILIDTTGLTVLPDGIHLDTAGCKQHGIDSGQAILPWL